MAGPHTTGQVMKFVVGTAVSAPERMVDPGARLFHLPSPPVPGHVTRTPKVSLGEIGSETTDADPIAGLLGLVVSGTGVPKFWDDPVSENPVLTSTEIWEIGNYTDDAHPIR